MPRPSRTREQTLIDTLARASEPLVSTWASAHRRQVRDPEDLLRALERLQADGGPRSRALAATIWLTWRGLAVS